MTKNNNGIVKYEKKCRGIVRYDKTNIKYISKLDGSLQPVTNIFDIRIENKGNNTYLGLELLSYFKDKEVEIIVQELESTGKILDKEESNE